MLRVLALVASVIGPLAGLDSELCSLPPELALSNGQVACVTCHNPGSRERYHVPITLSGSALCLACHRM